jgi:hypothetical protein
MPFLDRLAKHGLVHTMSCSSNNGAFPVTEKDIAQYQKELAQQLGPDERRGRSIEQCSSSSSSSCSVEDCIVVHKSVTAVDVLQGGPIESTNNNKLRTSSCDEFDDMDNDSGYTFDMSLLPGQTSTQEGPDDSENVFEVTLDENNMNPQGEDNVLLLRSTKKPLTVRGKAKQVILKPLRSSWCFVKDRVRSFRKWQREQTSSWGRKHRRNLDHTASLDDEENELSEETQMEFEQVCPSVSGGALSFRSSNDNDDDVPSSTHPSR